MALVHLLHAKPWAALCTSAWDFSNASAVEGTALEYREWACGTDQHGTDATWVELELLILMQLISVNSLMSLEWQVSKGLIQGPLGSS